MCSDLETKKKKVSGLEEMKECQSDEDSKVIFATYDGGEQRLVL